MSTKTYCIIFLIIVLCNSEVKKMKEEFIRTAAVLGEEAIERLSKCSVAVFGIGGVGGHAAEALARAGIGSIDLIDFDTVSLSNINRQIVALHSTLGMKKTDVLRERLKDINPDISINCYPIFYSEETKGQFDLSKYDYIIDAIDSVKAKTELIVNSYNCGTKIISAMGAGNKLDPTAFKVSDIYKTSVCPLARVMRNELKKRGVKRLKCVYSQEQPKVKSQTVGSLPFVPSVMGMIISGEVIKDLIIK